MSNSAEGLDPEHEHAACSPMRLHAKWVQRQVSVAATGRYLPPDM